MLHRWQILLAAALLGCLLGWGLSWIWPAHYRAASQIYIALNPYRKFSDSVFEALANPKYSNLDNYHYWQMSQLESAITMDGFLEPVLDRLREIDPYWENVDIAALRSILKSEWRTSGTWSLIANHRDSAYASQAARVWSDVVVEQVGISVAAAIQMIFIDEQLQAGENEMLSSSMRLQDLMEVRSSLDEWQRQSEKGDPTIPFDANQRASLSALVAFPAEFTPAWMNALEGMPPAEAPLRDYQGWIGQIQRVVQLEIDSLNRRLRQLDADQIELAQSYSIESKASHGFSPNIIIDRKEDLGARQIRPTSVFVLVGGIVGLLIGLLIQLIMILPPWKCK